MIINPITQRKIKIDGKTFKDLIVVRGYTRECLLNLPFFDSDKTIPIELWQEILYQSDINLVKSILCTNKHIYNTYNQNNLFWTNKFNIDNLPITNLNIHSYIKISDIAKEIDDILKIIRLYPIKQIFIYKHVIFTYHIIYKKSHFTFCSGGEPFILDVDRFRYFIIDMIRKYDVFINIYTCLNHTNYNLRLYHLKKNKDDYFAKRCLSLLKI